MIVIRRFIYCLSLIFLVSCADESSRPCTGCCCCKHKSAGAVQKESIVTKPSVNDTLELLPFIPKKYTLFAFKKGDLNRDSLPDIVMVAHLANERELCYKVNYTLKRPALILLRQKNGLLKEIKRNDNLILSYESGGMFGEPFQGIDIDSLGGITFKHYGGSRYRWTKNLLFCYSPLDSDWVLTRYDEYLNDMLELDDYMTPDSSHKTPKDFGRLNFRQTNLYKL